MKTKFLLLLANVIFIVCSCSKNTNQELVPFAQLLPETEFNGNIANAKNLGAFNFSANTDFAFVGEVYPINLKTYGRVWDFGPSDSSNFRFHQNTDSTARVAVGSFDHVLNVPSYWNLNTWIKAAVYYNNATQELRLYKNGLLVGTQTGVTIPAGQRQNLIIGASNWGANFPNSPETDNPVMKTRNFQFYFGTISQASMQELLDKQ